MAGRMLVLDDQRLVAESIAGAMLARAGIDAVAMTPDDAWRAVLTDRRPDIVAVGSCDRDRTGVASEIRATWPGVPTLVIIRPDDDRAALRAIQTGCTGVVTSDRSLGELVDAIESVLAGELRFPASLLARAIHESRGPRALDPDVLTRREHDVLQLVAEGLTNAAIAERLGVSHNTVRSHVQHVLDKLGVHSKLEAAVVAARHGLTARG